MTCSLELEGSFISEVKVMSADKWYGSLWSSILRGERHARRGCSRESVWHSDQDLQGVKMAEAHRALE